MVQAERPKSAATAPGGYSRGPDNVSMTRYGLVDSPDGKYILAPFGSSVRVLNTRTGQEVRSLKGHFGEVTAVCLDPSSPEQAYTASLDGTLRLWNYHAGTALEVHTLHHPIKYMVIHAPSHLAYLSVPWADGAAGRLFAYDLVTQRLRPEVARVKVAGTLALGSPSGLLAAAVDRHSLLVWRAAEGLAGHSLNLHHGKTYTCVAISSDDSVMAAGDVTGRIQIWRNVGKHIGDSAVKRSSGGAATPSSVPPALPVATTVHWHANPVGCLAFAFENTFLYSGGLESVLVSWRLDNNSPSFLPRLGGGLLGIHVSCADPARLIIRQDDNTMRILNMATRSVERSIYGLQPPPFAVPPELLTGAVTVCPSGTGAVLSLPVTNAELQLFDLLHQRHVALVQIAPRNKVSFSDRSKEWGPAGPPPPPHVCHVAFSSDGAVLVTVDVRPGEGLSDSRSVSAHCLKFWDLVNATTLDGHHVPYALNTRVDEPHRGPIRCVRYHPSRHVVVTTGGEGDHTESHTFRVWAQTRVPPLPGSRLNKATAWHCRCVGSYLDYVMGAAAFSGDGSVLAVTAGPNVTLWDPQTCELSAVLAPGNCEPALQHVAFVHGSRFLVAASSHSLMVWDVLTTALHWTRQLGVCDLAVDPLTPGTFAVAVPYCPRASADQAAVLSAAAKQKVKQQAGSKVAVQQIGQDATAATAAAAADEPATAAVPAAPTAAALTEALRPACSVLVFAAESPMPLYQCTVPNSSSVVMRYGPPSLFSREDEGSPSSASGRPGPSPLVIITADRRIIIGAPPRPKDQPGATAGSAGEGRSTELASTTGAGGAGGADQPAGAEGGGVVRATAAAVLAGQMGRLALERDGDGGAAAGPAPDDDDEDALHALSSRLGPAGRRDVVFAARQAALTRRRLAARLGVGQAAGASAGPGATPTELQQQRKVLLDAPSHVLPRASATALAFMELFG